MTNFEYVGMKRQYACKSIEDCNEQLNVSCTRCVETGRCWRKCATCAINAAYETMMVNFESIELQQKIEEKLIRTQKRLGLV